ncbi:protein zyg-11 homolog [Astyanax mexicanus]|uniref:protein zyg-11 homolog n=1 Tax=Astyanax mexicanus TaxID=7994 RepID=UPI0020CB1E18|nr:protein zyg-11 homolog [Astyanax mexicanus]
MEGDAPPALSRLCVECVCGNLPVLCRVCGEDGSLRFCWCPVLPQELSDLLINTMAQQGVLDDRTVGVFRSTECLRLKRVCIRSCRLSAHSFSQALCSHRLQELNMSHLQGDITVSDVLQGILSNQHCRQSLQRLALTGLDLLSSSSDGRLRFSSLRALRTLGLAWTRLDDAMLEDICSLPLLDSLDISGTAVTDLTPLLNLQSHLRSLTAHGLHHLDMSTTSLLSILSKLDQLRHLDISNDRLDTDSECPASVVELLERLEVLPVLESLDVSGWSGISDGVLEVFVEARRGMRFLGLLATGAGASDFLSGEGNLKVAGEYNITQCNEALRRYREREVLLQRALLHLHNLTNQQDIGPQPHTLQLVCAGMQTHSESAGVQLVATACVFNLTNLELAMGVPNRLLGNVVQQLISTMRSFPNHQQIQKNCLLCLCSDHILQTVPFNRYEAVKQVMSCLSLYEDQTLQRMSVAVVSLLVSKLSVEEVGQLGAEEFIIKQLLSIVQQRASVGAVDPTLKFALSALWNLTDQTPSGCSMFLHNHGLELYSELLETYYFDSSIQQKVLGLLNNVAEVEELREQLMEEDLLEYILALLQGPQVEVGVSYFAGGVLAHLTSRTGPEWTLDPQLHHTILNRLHSSVMSWTPPDQEMVSYVSFQPFYPLLDHSQPSGVQLWALWGIQLVIRQNVSQYSALLEEEGGLDKLRELTSDPDVHTDVHTLALNTLHLLDTPHNCRAEDPRCV